MPQTATIRVSQVVRDRLAERARRGRLTIAAVIERALDEADDRDFWAAGTDVRARNRRGGQPLHAATIGNPGSSHWDPEGQGVVIDYLIRVGADPKLHTDQVGIGVPDDARHKGVDQGAAAETEVAQLHTGDPCRNSRPDVTGRSAFDP